MDLGIAKKRALVTGGAHGIGRAVVAALVAEGVSVAYTTRHQPPDRHGIQWDGQDPREVILKARDHWDGEGPDILVNNNGHTLGITDPYCAPEDWDAILELNFLSAVRLCNAVIPGMKAREWGRIVNITSCAGLENSGPVTYCAAKAALTAYTRSMARVLAGECDGIVMSAVYPSVIKTEGGHWDHADPAHAERYLRERVPTGRFQTLDEFVPVVAFYCSQQAAGSHGAIVSADQGQSRHFSPQTYM